MAYYLSVFLGAVFIALVLSAFRTLTKAEKVFPATIYGLFILANGVGIIVPVAFSNSYTNYDLRPEWVLESGLSCVPIAIALLMVLISRPRPRKPTPPALLSERAFIVCAILNLLAAVVVTRYLYLAGFEKLMGWTRIFDFNSAYAERYGFFNESGRGLFSSLVAANCVIPVCSALILGYARNRPVFLRYLCTAPALVFSLVRAAANLQRGPLLIQTLIVVLILLAPIFLNAGLVQSKSSHYRRLLLGLILGSCIFFGVGIAIFSRSNDRAVPLLALTSRVVVTPAHTSGLYFGLFPSHIPFRGILEAGYFPLGEWGDYKSGEINLKYIGYLSNGWAHHPNANFLASAYSGFGWPAVLVFSLIFIGTINWWSKFFWEIDPQLVYWALLVSAQGLFSITQADLLGAAVAGFGITQVFLIIMAAFGLHRMPYQRV